MVISSHPHMNDDDVAKEFAFCETLTTWQPFGEPDARLIEGMNNMASIEQLMYENEHAATLPDSMRHHAAARYRLRSNRVTAARLNLSITLILPLEWMCRAVRWL